MSNESKNILVRILDAALAPPAPPPPLTFDQLSRTIAGMATRSLLVKDEPELLHGQQVEYENSSRQIGAHTKPEAKNAWMQSETLLKKNIRNNTASDRDGWTLNDFYEDFFRKCELAKVSLSDISREAQPTAKNICGRFVELCLSVANEIEGREIADCKRFGLPHQASPLVQKIRETAAAAPRRIGGNTSPKNMLPYCDF